MSDAKTLAALAELLTFVAEKLRHVEARALAYQLKSETRPIYDDTGYVREESIGGSAHVEVAHGGFVVRVDVRALKPQAFAELRDRMLGGAR